MTLDHLPLRNAITLSIRNFRSSQTGTIITDDTSMVFNIYDSALALVEGPVAMSHASLGDYYGSVTPSPALTESARYKVVISSTTYPAEWVRWFTVEERGFPIGR